MYLKTFVRPPDKNFTYLFGPQGDAAGLAAVDPGKDVKPLLADAGSRPIKMIFATHGHEDHIEGLVALQKKTQAPIAAHRLLADLFKKRKIPLDVPLTGGQTLEIDGVPLRILFTPGHEPGSIAILVANRVLFTGDTLFVGNCGRCDLPGSDPQSLFMSLQMLGNLPNPEDVTIYPGHDYGKTPTSTIAREKRENAAMQAKTLEEFEAIP